MGSKAPGRILLEKLLNRMEAFSLFHFLDANGIAVDLQESFLKSALGEIPFLETAAKLYLLDPTQMDEARGLIRRFRENPASVRGLVWQCPSCEEQHEPEFGSCWNCGQVRS